MPSYEYRCANGHDYVEIRSIAEDQKVMECPECSTKLTRVFEPTVTIFNGSGFYKTDSQKK